MRPSPATEVTDAFNRDGWVLIPGVLGRADLESAISELDRIFPSGSEYAENPEGHPEVSGDQFAGVRMWPSGVEALDDLVSAEPLVDLAVQLTGAAEPRLLRAGYQAKYTGAADYSQVLHYDYPNHSLVVPEPNEIIGFFLYLSDIDEAHGATRLVSNPLSGPVAPHATHLPAGNPLYEAEVAAEGTLGSVLAYRSTTYHRGAPMTADAGRRLTLAYSYGVASSATGYASWPRLGEDPHLVDFIRRASPRARTLLGFPPPGDLYWTQTSGELVERRYGIDLHEYRSSVVRET